MTQGFKIEAGAIIGSTYRVVERIGAGGMGEVWRAEHVRLPGLRAAIKFLFVEQVSPEGMERFEREGVVMAGLNHPHITRVFDFNTTPEGVPYIVLELLEGEPLSARLERGPLPLDELCLVLSQTASALQVTHAKGIIHRDLKPDNIFLHQVTDQPAPMVKVLDFGVSKVRGVQKITMHQRGFLGTPHYMSPEQALGREDVTPAADQFSLAIIVYEMLSGRLPFDGEQVIQIATQVVQAEPPPIQTLVPDLPSAAAAVLHKALSKRPAERFESCKEFAEAFMETLYDDEDWASDAHTEVIAESRAALRLADEPQEDEQATLQLPSITDRALSPELIREVTAPDLLAAGPTEPSFPARDTLALSPLSHPSPAHIPAAVTPASFYPIAHPAAPLSSRPPAHLQEATEAMSPSALEEISKHQQPTMMLGARDVLGAGADFPTSDPLEPDPPRGGGLFRRVLAGLALTALAVGGLWALRPRAHSLSPAERVARLNTSAVVQPAAVEPDFRHLARRVALSPRSSLVALTADDLAASGGELRVSAPTAVLALIELSERELRGALGAAGGLHARLAGPEGGSREEPFNPLPARVLEGLKVKEGLSVYAAPLSFTAADEGRWTVGVVLQPARGEGALVATLPLRLQVSPPPARPKGRRGR